jgi:hypothetical protein
MGGLSDHRCHQVKEERTFPVDPQQGTCYLPFLEDVAVTEPLRRSPRVGDWMRCFDLWMDLKETAIF